MNMNSVKLKRQKIEESEEAIMTPVDVSRGNASIAMIALKGNGDNSEQHSRTNGHQHVAHAKREPLGLVKMPLTSFPPYPKNT